MALHYLSGDNSQMGLTFKKKKAAKPAKPAKPTKPKKAAVIGLVPVRTAALAVISLNLLKTGTKLARVWNKPGGKEDLKQTWIKKLGGDPSALQKAIAKGSKQTISGDDMGIAVEATIAAATPALIILAALIKKYAAGGDAAEASEFDQGIADGKQTLADDPDIQKGNLPMPIGVEVGIIKPKPGGGEPVAGSLGLNPGSISFFFPLLISVMTEGWEVSHPSLYLIASIIMAYCMIGMFVCPFAIGMFGEKLRAVTLPYFSVPAEWLFYKPINFINGKVKKFALSRTIG